jgi:DNA-binding NarL/FixJ family response regulator
MGIRILIADDDSLIRESLKIILSMDSEIHIVDCVDNGLKALEACIRNDIDVALLDIRMPILNGVEAVKQICEKTNTKPLILTTFDEDDYIRTAIKYGAKGYILKNNSPDKIINAIKMVHSGNTVMQDTVLDKIKDGLEDKRKCLDESMFTERELEIVIAIADGLSNKEISSKLYISEGTVKNYITNILSKTNLKHRTQIAILYLKGNA